MTTEIQRLIGAAADALAPYLDAEEALEVAEVVVQAIRNAGYFIVGEEHTVFMHHNLPLFDGETEREDG